MTTYQVFVEIVSLNASVPKDTVKAVNVDFFDEDLSITKEGFSNVEVTFVLTPQVVIEVTEDGDEYYTINSANPLKAQSEYIFKFNFLQETKFNIRTPTVDGCTIKICRVQEMPPAYE